MCFILYIRFCFFAAAAARLLFVLFILFVLFNLFSLYIAYTLQYIGFSIVSKSTHLGTMLYTYYIEYINVLVLV